MKKTVVLFLFFVISKSLFSQWVIDNFDDGFSKYKFIHTEFYINPEYGCHQPSYLALAAGNLYLVSDCLTGDRSRIWSIEVIFTVDGKEKKYSTYDYGGKEFSTKLLSLNSSFKLDGSLTGESLESLLKATYIKIKASNLAYEPIYFKMKLTPSNTEQAWDSFTDGKYFAEKKLKEERIKLEKQKEQERIALEKQRTEEDTKTINKINELLKNSLIDEAALEYKKLHIKYDKVTNTIKSKLDSIYNSDVNIMSLNPYTIEDYIQKNKTKLQSLPAGIYLITFDKNGVPDNTEFPSLTNVPQKTIEEFKILLKSKAEIRVEEKAPLLISTTYTSGSTKEIFYDSNENFYFKSKSKSYPLNVSHNPSLEKDVIQINKTYKIEKYINGILVTSRSYSSEKNVKILKKDY